MEILVCFHMKLFLHLFFICTKDLLHSSESITEELLTDHRPTVRGSGKKGKKVL